MEVVGRWTNRRATTLQRALRLTNEGFAGELGIAPRTVASWHEKPDSEPREEQQQLLDIVFERSTPAVRSRYEALLKAALEKAQALRVAIAVIVHDGRVLLVCRRGDDEIRWQFPAGVVKPGAKPEAAAVREVLAETGVHVAVDGQLGERLHPVTGVLCSYWQCTLLAGTAVNADPDENVAVEWVPAEDVSRWIPADRIYPPVMAALEGKA